jgi:hypothetical protein
VDLVAAWKKQRGTELAAAAAGAAVKRLADGDAWDAVAKSLGAVPLPAKFVARTDQAVPTEIRREAFQAARPAGKPTYANLALGNGDAAVLAVSAVREDPSDPREQEAQLRRQFAQQAASSEAQGYAAAARADAKVTVNLEALN